MPKQMEDLDIILKYLVGNLPPDQRSELNQLLGKGSVVSANDPDDDDFAQDALRGRISMDRLPERMRRQVAARTAPNRTASTAGFYERFPEASHIRRG